MMHTVHRHHLGRFAWNLLLALAVINTLLLVGNLATIGIGLGFLLPVVPTVMADMLVYSLPMATLAAATATLARARQDGDFTTLAAGGVRVAQAAAPFLGGGLLLALLALAVCEWLQPAAVRSQRAYIAGLGVHLLEDVLSRKQAEVLLGERTIFLFQNESGGTSALIQERKDDRIARELYATSLQWSLDRVDRILVLDLRGVSGMRYEEDGQLHPFSAEASFLRIPYDRGKVTRMDSLRNASLSGILDMARRTENVGERRRVMVFFHEKLVLAMSPLVLALAAFCAAFIGGRSSRFHGFAAGLAIAFVVFYPLLLFARRLILDFDAGPVWLVMQTPNIALACIAAAGLALAERRI